MEIDVNVENEASTLTLRGRFDFSAHREFRASYQGAIDDPAITEVVLNFAQVEYVDSSALGMLLLLKEKATAANKTVILAECGGFVMDVFQVVNFQQLFTFR